MHRLLKELFDFERPETRGALLHYKLFELFLLQYAVRWAWEWGLYIQRLHGVVVPQGIARHLDISFMFTGHVALVNAALITLCAVAVLFHTLPRLTLTLLVPLLHLQYVARHSLGKVAHGSHYVGIGILILAVAAWGLTSPQSRRVFAVGSALFFMGAGYVSAAICKLARTGGEWADGRHLAMWIAEKRVDGFAITGDYDLNWLQQFCADHRSLATAFLAVGLLSELCGFLLWFRRTRVFIALALVGLHLGIYWTMEILFDTYLYQVVLLALPWPALIDRVLARRLPVAQGA